MTLQRFYRIANELFGGVLMPLGFTNSQSRRCTFYRKVANDVYHFIVPDPATRVAWYDVKVFPASPRIDPLFHARFPDGLGIPTDSWSYLSPRGVGPDQELFNCKYEENMRRRFEKTVAPLLRDVAIPYLNRIRTVEEMIPWLRRPLALGLALDHIGKKDEARPLLEQERERLRAVRDEGGELAPILARLDQVLGES